MFVLFNYNDSLLQQNSLMYHGTNHNGTVPVNIHFSFWLCEHSSGKRGEPTCLHGVVDIWACLISTWILKPMFGQAKWWPLLFSWLHTLESDFVKSWYLKIPLKNISILWTSRTDYLKKIVLSKNLSFYNIFFFRKRSKPL